ncbi:cupin domain-containing protein [Actinoallomurus sp. CA-150999]|uniref:cupin domain-containing protein n=1 Tax=Actinoallomurus sp. CA-150999 TaxID=3239887 RepID=UPI003D935E83
MTERFSTVRLDEAPEVTAPDGSAVRPLCVLAGAASFAQFELAPGETAKAVSHATVEEIWFVTSGAGEIWRSQGGREEVTVLEPGICLTIPLGTTFQFRAGAQRLRVVAATVPPWPVNSPDEARPEPGRW